MKSKTSLFNKGIIYSCMKRFWWIGVSYFIVLFFLLPFQLLMKNDFDYMRLKMELEYNPQIKKYVQLLMTGDAIQIILILAIPVLLAVLLFRYLQTGRSAAVIHGFPLKRKTIYFSHSVTAFCLYSVPVIIIGLILGILELTGAFKGYLSMLDILQWTGVTLIFGNFLVSTAIFAGMFTGNSIAQIAFTYIFNLLPVGIYTLVNMNFSIMLHGYSDRVNNFPSWLDPITLLWGYRSMSQSLTLRVALAYAFIALLMMIAAYYVYKKRKLETAGDLIAFPILSPIFKYGMTACCMLFGGLYLASVSKASFPITVLGYILGSLIGYFIAEVLMQRSLRIWNAYKGYLIYAAVAFIVIISVKLDITGYVHRIPDLERVKEAYIGYDYNANFQPSILNYPQGYHFKSPENIRKVMLVHKYLSDIPDDKKGSGHYIVYTLKNGSKMIRQYNVDERLYQLLLKPIYESDEYKIQAYPLIRQKADIIRTVDIGDNRVYKRPVAINNLHEIQRLIEVFKKDIGGMTYEELFQPSKSYIGLSITGVDKTYQSYYIDENYKATFEWLKERGYLDKVIATPDDIGRVTIETVNSVLDSNGNIIPSESAGKKIEIDNDNVKKELFYSYLPDNDKVGDKILANFYLKEDPVNLRFSGYIYNDTPVSPELEDSIKQLNK